MSSNYERQVHQHSNDTVSSSKVALSSPLTHQLDQPFVSSLTGQNVKTLNSHEPVVSRTSSTNDQKSPPVQNSGLRLDSTASASNLDTITENLKFQKELDWLRGVISKTSVKVVQIILRDQWQNLLTDLDESCATYMCQLLLRYTDVAALEKVFLDEKLFESPICDFLSKKRQMITRVLHSVTHDQLISLVPRAVLDRMIAEHVKSVPARDLVRWLASADRLGYKLDDILVNDDNDDELVVPNEMSQDLHFTLQEKKIQECPTANNTHTNSSARNEKDTISLRGQLGIGTTIQHSHGLYSADLKKSRCGNQQQAIMLKRPKEQLKKSIQSKTLQQARPAGLISESSSSVVTNVQSHYNPQRMNICKDPVSSSNISHENIPGVSLPQSNHMCKNSSSLLPSRTSYCLPSSSKEPVRESENVPSQRALINFQNNFPFPNSLERSGENFMGFQRPSVLGNTHTNHSSQWLPPQSMQLAQKRPLNSSHMVKLPCTSCSFNSPSTVIDDQKVVSFLQDQNKIVGEISSKDGANFPAGISQDRRIARFNSIANSAPSENSKLEKLHSSYISTHQASREMPNVNPNSQVLGSGTKVYGAANIFPQIITSTIGVSGSPSMLPVRPLPSSGNSVQEGHFSCQSVHDTQIPLTHQTCQSNGNCAILKRPRDDDSESSPRVAGPNQSLNGRIDLNPSDNKNSVDNLKRSPPMLTEIRSQYSSSELNPQDKEP